MATNPGSTSPKLMERLDLADGQPYSAIEAAIHLARYALALPFCAGRTVLDIACGQGYGAWLMAERWGAARVAAVDSAPEALAAARRYFPSPRIEYREGRAEQLAELYPPEHFDLVVSLETIEHLADPTAFLRGVRHVLRPGGHAVISCPNDHLYYPTDAERNPFHVRKYLLDEFLALAESELGPARTVLLGFPLAGFINLNADELAAVAPAGMRTLVDAKPDVRALTLPPNEPFGPERSRYFVGVWGPGEARPVTATLYPVLFDDSLEAHCAKQIDSLREEVTHLRTEAAQQAKRAAALAQAHADKERAARQVELRLAAVQAEYEYVREEALALRRELHATQTRANEFAERTAHLDRMLAEREQALADARSANEQLHGDLRAAESARGAAELRLATVQAELERALDDAHKANEQLRADLEAAEGARRAAELRLASVQAELDNARNEASQLRRHLDWLEQQRSGLAARVADLERTWSNRIWGLGRRILHRLRGRR